MYVRHFAFGHSQKITLFRPVLIAIGWRHDELGCVLLCYVLISFLGRSAAVDDFELPGNRTCSILSCNLELNGDSLEIIQC